MNKNNLYIFIYASVLVILVAAILSVTATVLKPYQDKNKEIARKLNILHSVDKGWDSNQATSKNDYVEQQYEKYITGSLVVNSKGDSVKGVDAFAIDLEKEYAKPPEERVLPVFFCAQDDGSKNIILPLRGKGLWGPIWGYISLQDDFNTIAGAVFDHSDETPGLGAEISTRPFQLQFIGKKLFDDEGHFVSVSVNKSNEPKTEFHSVDAISGGTITSKGLQKMIADCMTLYLPYIESNKNR